MDGGWAMHVWTWPSLGWESNLCGEAGKHDTTSRVWEGQGEGWKKDGKESTVKNEILKGRLEMKSDRRVCDKSKNGEMMFITVPFPPFTQPSLHLSQITDFIWSFFENKCMQKWGYYLPPS